MDPSDPADPADPADHAPAPIPLEAADVGLSELLVVFAEGLDAPRYARRIPLPSPPAEPPRARAILVVDGPLDHSQFSTNLECLGLRTGDFHATIRGSASRAEFDALFARCTATPNSVLTIVVERPPGFRGWSKERVVTTFYNVGEPVACTAYDESKRLMWEAIGGPRATDTLANLRVADGGSRPYLMVDAQKMWSM